MNKVYEKAYAKVNLGLKVGKKRFDGYHNIETLMARIDLCDNITLKDSEDIVIEGMNITLKENLMYKVITLVKNKYNIKNNVKVEINKKIPIGAGLGGGSSNAAAIIRGLNKLWNLNLSIEMMEELGQIIGSDVPFFITGKTSHVMGRGEILNKVKLSLPYKLLLVNLAVNISTKTVYENYREKNNFNFEYNIANLNLHQLKNDLETVYKESYPEISILMNNIKHDLGGELNIMSGSGPTIFALYNKNKCINQIKQNIERKYNVFVFESFFIEDKIN